MRDSRAAAIAEWIVIICWRPISFNGPQIQVLYAVRKIMLDYVHFVDI